MIAFREHRVSFREHSVSFREHSGNTLFTIRWSKLGRAAVGGFPQLSSALTSTVVHSLGSPFPV